MAMEHKAILVISAILVLCAAVAGTAFGAVDGNDDKVIYVSGTGTVTTDPDEAMVSLSVETEHANVNTAQQTNAQRMNAVIDALKGIGITSADLKTTGYSIYPVRDSDSGSILSPTVKYYRVTNTLLVTLTDITKVGAVIDTAVANGADRTDYISFSVSDEKQEILRTEALTDAVRRARSDANAVTAAMGVTIIGVKDVNVGSYYPPVRYDTFAGAEKSMASSVPTPIEPNTVDVTATVSITYLIG